ncbi:helix-turn-helix domain-containing protein [Amycolatopsis sp. EV170708-02-1]|uniref:helix-turn-helix domain-containing protein n=1 Tax=Amycolatopsis sp. EV170708-02-1 TaxID=2919322 RepID=UPI001F0B8DD8|nr:helix-turn-helix domain-containing protein [Amycolatopsis sp. EV170708-02-1]UMP04140.1 helix-turn-helix domain-containing protein [Amycolatopsis sp. EV170708-02-1]
MAKLVARYAHGDTIEGLAKQHQLSYHKVRNALLDANVKLRPPKIPLPPTPPGMVNAYNGGRSIRQLAAIHGMSYCQTRRILLAEGVQLRPRGRQ